VCVLATNVFFHAAGNVHDDNETRNGPFDDPEFRRPQWIEWSIFILSTLTKNGVWTAILIVIPLITSHFAAVLILIYVRIIKFLLYIRKIRAPHDDRPGAFPVALVIVLVLSAHPVRMRLVVLAKMNHLKIVTNQQYESSLY
jgi:hypothetical protein